MRLCFAELYDGESRLAPDPERYIARQPIHRHLTRALAARGHEVHVVYLYPHDCELEEGGVHHHFVRGSALVARGARVLGRLGRDPGLYHPAFRAIARIRSLRPDLVHFHGVTLTWNLALTLLALGRHRPPIVVHSHGGFPARHWLARRAQRFGLRRAARVLFTTRAHAQPFVDAGAIAAGSVDELMETSSTFEWRPRADARRDTGMKGDPVFLWAGRLAAIKDPLTALRGFEEIASHRPGARLYLHYLTDELLPELRAFVDARPQLAARVHFAGRAAPEQMEAIYNSADFLLQASAREFSGLVVLEAMACGVIPVVTEIPSFVKMTRDGQYGVLFPPGDATALARGVLALSPPQIAALSPEVRRRFERDLSFPALAEQLDALYAKLA